MTTYGQIRRAKRNEKIVAMYQRGLSTKDIAAKFEITPEYVLMLLKKAGVSLRPRRPFYPVHLVAYSKAREKTRRNRDMRRERAAGASLQELADRYGVSKQRAGQIVSSPSPRTGGTEG